MAIAKSLYEAPQGLESLTEPDLEIEIENPEGVHIGMDGIEIDLEPETESKEGEEFDSNLAEFMDEGELEKLGSEVVELVEADINSRKDWLILILLVLTIAKCR